MANRWKKSLLLIRHPGGRCSRCSGGKGNSPALAIVIAFYFQVAPELFNVIIRLSLFSTFPERERARVARRRTGIVCIAHYHQRDGKACLLALQLQPVSLSAWVKIRWVDYFTHYLPRMECGCQRTKAN